MDTDPQWSDTTETLSFRIEIGGKTHVARISAEALEDHFGAAHDPASQVLAYRAHFEVINQKAAQKMMGGAQEPVLLTTKDF